LSFGTGQHPTTAFCLRQLARRRNRGESQSFLDIGTGSGILAIAAAKLGYAPVHAFDFDPEAVRASKTNLRKNRVANRISLRHDDLTKMPMSPRRRFDVICANVTYDLLAHQAERISRHLSPNGSLIAAGILEEQFPFVTKSFQRFGLTLRGSELQNIWRSGQFAFS
jgi:ribosomal protein L11 methyltransferase